MCAHIQYKLTGWWTDMGAIYAWKTAGLLRYHCVWTLQQAYYGYPYSNSSHFFLPSHASNSHVVSSKRKSQSTCSYNHRGFEGIRMHIDNTAPWAITGLIFLPDKQSASLWAFSWHLTSAFHIESSLLMQKMKWLRALLNISELFNHNFAPS